MQLTFTNQRIADKKRAICAPRLISNQSPRFLSSLTAHMMPILRRIDFYRKIFYTRLTTTITTKNYVDQCMDVLSEAKIGTMNLLCIYFSQLLLLLLQLISICACALVYCLEKFTWISICCLWSLRSCISTICGKLFLRQDSNRSLDSPSVLFFPLFVNCCCHFNEYKSYLLKIVYIGNANSGTSSNWLGWRIIAIKNIEIPGHLHSPKRNEDSSFPASVIVNACQDYEGRA